MAYSQSSGGQEEQHGRRGFRLLVLVAIVVVLLIVLPGVAGFVTDWLWFKELGRTDVYWKLTWGPWLLGGIAGLTFFALVFGNILLAVRATSDAAWMDLRNHLASQALNILTRTLRRIAVWGSAIVTFLVALGIGSAAAQSWPRFLLFLHAQQVGTTEPIFQRDVGFYLFRLPVWNMFGSWLFFALIFTLIVTTIIYLTTRTIRMVRGTPVFSPAVQWHLSVLLALALIVKAVQYYLGRFTTLSAANGDFVGPFYTDLQARIPSLSIMAVLALLAAAFVLIGVIRRNILLPVSALVILIIASVLLLGGYPSLLQRFRVVPNQLTLETPQLKHHIRMTREAYGVDKVSRQPFTINPQLSSTALTASPGTVKNIRLWDYRPLLQVYSQYQELRSYYDIANVDVDRYKIDGQSRQVMLAARELNVNNIPEGKIWVNKHLVYTHGYGLVMSPVNEVDHNKGGPNFFVNNIPPQSAIPSLKVTQPGIYFGEAGGEYIVVKGREQEFDYPSGNQNAYTTYQGTAGIPLNNPFVRLMAAARFGDINLLISNSVTPESRLVFRRQIVERVRTVAPFLSYDKDPYLVVGTDGKLYWMLDAYTSSVSYPYSRFSTLQTANNASETVNYLRNPVKVVVDAYNGSINFYLADADEPIIRAWQEIFPAMFQPMSAMPAGLTEHVRVPEGFFNTISDVYRRYHLSEDQVNVFFQQEDLWDIPGDSSGVSQNYNASPMEAYYLIMSPPGKKEPEYLLIRPYTPHGKRNMIAWLSARSDPEHYGDLLAYEFPKESQFSGPEQVQSTINTEPEISSAISLWNTSGSKVLWGNLLVIPIDSTVLYVRPLYLQAENSPIPELQRVVVADQRRVVMRNTLGEALAALSGGTVTSSTTPPPPPQPGAQPQPAGTSPEEKALARSALEHYRRAQEALKKNDWATYGKEMDAVHKDLEELSK